MPEQTISVLVIFSKQKPQHTVNNVASDQNRLKTSSDSQEHLNLLEPLLSLSTTDTFHSVEYFQDSTKGI